MPDSLSSHVREIQSIAAVPRMLETVAALTGLRFVCIAHVTATSWTTCAVYDQLGFGLVPGAQLDVTTTLCEEVRETRATIVIDCVRDSDCYRDHHTPRIYGFQSYFSIPIFRPDGFYFGTLCGLDPEPRKLSEGAIVPALTLFAELISHQLETERSLNATRSALLSERETAELREQFIAVLGHDLRTPLGAILGGAELLARRHDDPVTRKVVERMRSSALRMTGLVDNVVDFTRGRMGSGLALDLSRHNDVDLVLDQVVDELRGVYPDRAITSSIARGIDLRCDPQRLAQLLSNLLKNALVHGDPAHPIAVEAGIDDAGFILVVNNRGPQLGPDIIAQLFKPYWRAISRPGDEGLGLGLYIVDQIARAHGGAIAVQSDHECTTFTFSMPAA
jgi:signal transduction histidine kinase